MTKKSHISQIKKLAAALLTVKVTNDRGDFVPAISYDEAKGMSAEAIVSRFDFDHDIEEAVGGATEPWNLTPRLRADHRRKTATRDVPRIRKAQRLEKAAAEHRGVMLAKTGKDPSQTTPTFAEFERAVAGRSSPQRKSKWPQGRKLAGPGFRKPDKVKIHRFKPGHKQE